MNKPPRGVSFKYKKGWDELWLPCGKCEGCRADQAKEWAIRCYHESTQHSKNCFLTLTYDDEHLPHDGKIHKEHLQKFFRAVRDKGYKIRYFACGEYGDQTRRPHYHAIIFGEDFKHDKIETLGSCLSATKYNTGNNTYVSETLHSCWVETDENKKRSTRGYIQCAEVNMATICYVAGYAAKKIGDSDTFNLMSRRPGIGHQWLEKYKDDIKNTGQVSIEGKSYPAPKRYLDWEENYLLQVKIDRQKYVAENERHADIRLEAKKRNLRSKRKQRGEKL